MKGTYPSVRFAAVCIIEVRNVCHDVCHFWDQTNCPYVIERCPYYRGVCKERLDHMCEPPLSGHPWGTGKWPLNRDWLLNKGLL